MSHITARPLKALLIAIAAVFLSLTAAPGAAGADDAAAAADARGAHRCHDAAAAKRKTSLGIHQWTVRLEVEWCVLDRGGRPRIVSVDRDTTIRTGTNWRLISRSGGIETEGRRATAESRFHFRLRYPYLEQNCYPRLALTVSPDGSFERTVRTGC
jgi:hypothetical protein